MQVEALRIDFRNDNLLTNLKIAIDSIRKIILQNRSGQRHVRYQAYFFNNTPIEFKNGNKTEKDDYFEVQINAKTLYPKKVQGKENRYELKHFRGNKLFRVYELDPRYTSEYTVFDALGVLVAEQLRFNTLDLCKKEGIDFLNSQDMFVKIWKKYSIVYLNWAKLTLGTLTEQQKKMIPAGVEVLVKYLK